MNSSNKGKGFSNQEANELHAVTADISTRLQQIGREVTSITTATPAERAEVQQVVEKAALACAKADELSARFALMGNTNDVIRWEELRKRLESSPPAISNEARCLLTLRAVNGEKLSATQWNQLVGATVVNAPEHSRFSLPAGDREWLADALQRLIISERGMGLLVAQIASKGVILVPDFLKVGHRVVAVSVTSALAYGLWLFVDPNENFGHALCRCQYSKCRRFYLLEQKGPGAPSRAYCPDKPEHRREGDKEKAAVRMQKVRRKRR